MTVLVTGAGGFIGSHLVEELAGHGHRVRALDLRLPAFPELPGVECLTGDVTDGEACGKAAAGCDAVCHLAAKVGDWGPDADYFRINVGGTETLLGAAREARVRRFVLVSSVSVHAYRGHAASDETAPRDADVNAYARSKIAAEDVVSRATGLEWAIVRPGVFPFGPRDTTSFIHLARVLERGLGGFIGDGSALLTTAYVENLVLGMRLVLERPEAAGQAFVISDDRPVTWRELFTRFSDALGAPLPRLSVPYPLALAAATLMEAAWRLADAGSPPPLTRYRVLLAGNDCRFVSTKARRLLGYRPRIGLEEGIRRTVEWYRTERKSP